MEGGFVRMFEVNTTVTKESCKARAKASMAHHVREIYVLTIGLALGAAILYAIRSPKANIVAAIFAVAALYNAFAVQLTSMHLYASRNTAVNSIFLVFEENALHIVTSVEETRLGYDRITHMNENSGFLILYFKHHVPIAFKKTEVLNHRADELKAFLEAKTDRSFRSFRR